MLKPILWNLIVIASLLVVSPVTAECVKDSKGEIFCGAGECTKDRKGEVWCSKFLMGDAVRNKSGQVVCGIGQCRTDNHGSVFCSSEQGGAVMKDRKGDIRCYGECVLALPENCESNTAGSSIL